MGVLPARLTLVKSGARQLSDIAWVIFAQGGAALGTLVGVRLLTQFVSPETFGVVSLGLGVAALAMNVGCTPLTQAALHFYPDYAARNAVPDLRHLLFGELRRAAGWVLPIAVIGAVAYVVVTANSGWSVDPLIFSALLLLLLVCDVWRSASLALLNAAREHKRYAIWQTADAWLRPLLATGAVLLLSATASAGLTADGAARTGLTASGAVWPGLTANGSASVVLAAYVVASALVIAAFSVKPARPTAAPPKCRPQATQSIPGMLSAMQAVPAMQSRLARQSMWRYAAALVPLGLIGWANGVGDRYIIGGFLGLAEAGIYAAAYGLASRPLVMLAGTIELAVRPVYQAAVSKGDNDKANRLLQRWLITTITAGGLCVGLIAAASKLIAALLLGPEFRSGAELLPWIAAGYWLLTISFVFERVCYAHARTSRVLLIQSCTAVAAIIATTLGALHWGLMGAAIAVPVYFSVQLMVSIALARHTLAQGMHTPVHAEAAR